MLSARVLGHDYGVTSEEMNRILKKLGFLDGTPGDYCLTAKAKPFAVEHDFHRGNGGYGCYNRYWTTRTFDESIKGHLVVTPEIISEVKQELSAERAIRYAVQSLARAEADKDFLAKQAAEKAALEANKKAIKGREQFISNCKTACGAVLIIGGVIVICYGIYQLAPKAKAWISKRRCELREE